MKVFLCLAALVVCSSAVLPSFEEALESNDALLKLYRNHVQTNHLKVGLKNDKIRITLFKKSIEKVVEINNEGLGWTAGVTQFATMTPAEKRQWLGRNSTLARESAPIVGEVPQAKRMAGSVDWRQRRAVSPIRSQKGGTCWTYSSIHALEGKYAVVTGRLQEFTPQILVDCIYNGNGYNNGGIQNDAFNWIKRTGVVPGWSDYPPVSRANRCNTNRPNRMTGVRFEGYYQIGKNSAALANALNIAPTTTNYHVSDSNYYYTGGYYSDPQCRSGFNDLNHAVTAVGYDSSRFIIKNSWGTTWGDKGFGYWRRSGTGCGLFQDNLQVKMSRAREEEE